MSYAALRHASSSYRLLYARTIDHAALLRALPVMGRGLRRVALHVGERVRERRLHDGLSQQAVARALDMDVSDYQDAEAGEANFTAEDIYSLCSILRVKVSWFFEGLET